jgi:hypothetical protein
VSNLDLIGRATATRRRIRKRRAQAGSSARSHCARIRLTAKASGQLASIQGLCYRFGKRESLAALFEAVCLPALKAYVSPYANRAREARERAREAKGAAQ